MKNIILTISAATLLFTSGQAVSRFVAPPLDEFNFDELIVTRIIWFEGWNGNVPAYNFWSGFSASNGSIPGSFISGMNPLVAAVPGVNMFGTEGVDFDYYTPTLSGDPVVQMDWGIAGSPRAQVAGWAYDLGGPVDFSSAVIDITAIGPTGVTGVGLVMEDANGGWASAYWEAGTAEFPNDTPTLLSFNVADISAVPVPAAVWLFGSGLIGLVGLARHKSV